MNNSVNSYLSNIGRCPLSDLHKDLQRHPFILFYKTKANFHSFKSSLSQMPYVVILDTYKRELIRKPP